MTQIQKISSRDNPKLKLVRKVRDGSVADKIFIEGLRLAEEALRSKISIEECFISTEFEKAKRGRELLDKLIDRKIQICDVSDSIFSTVADTKNSQGIILIGDRPPGGKPLIEKNLQKGHALVIFLSEINDPSNLGAVLRIAEAADVAGVISSKGSANAFSPKALRGAMGAGFRVLVWESAEIDEVLLWAKGQSLLLTATDVKAGTVYTKVDWKVPRLLVFGSEAHGLSGEVRQKMEEVIRIPMMNGVESLNLSVSCGILLFEALRQNSGL